MKVACGWAEFISPSGHVIARGRVTALDIVSPRRREGQWHGTVQYLRDVAPLCTKIGDVWLLRFKQGFELRRVELVGVDESWAPSGRRATVHVTSYDELVPSVVTELGGE